MIDPSFIHEPEIESEEVEVFENSLRPKALEDFFGQSEIKRSLSIAIPAAQSRAEPLEHILLHGSPGLGKTTLAGILAREMNAQLKMTSGPALEKPGDVAALLTQLKPGDVLFIDEIHRLRAPVEEVLYSAMEDYALDLMIGKGPSARSMRLSLPAFTLIGATTRLSMISAPLRDRFGNVFKLEFYENDELTELLLKNAAVLELPLDARGAVRLAQSSRKTPRIANRLLRRVRDMWQVGGRKQANAELVEETLELLGVDSLGLDATDRRLLGLLAQEFRGRPVGLSTLSAAGQEEASTIADIYEPYWMQLGLLERTPKGRLATEKAYIHLGLTLQ